MPQHQYFAQVDEGLQMQLLNSPTVPALDGFVPRQLQVEQNPRMNIHSLMLR